MTAEARESTYRFSASSGLRLVGLAVLLFGVVWGVAGLAGFATWSLWLLAVMAAVVAAVIVRFLLFRPRLLTLSAQGYVIHHVRGNPVRTASWDQVEGAVTTRVAGASVVRIELANGRASMVPLALLGRQALPAQREIHDRLNTAYGYRPLENT